MLVQRSSQTISLIEIRANIRAILSGSGRLFCTIEQYHDTFIESEAIQA